MKNLATALIAATGTNINVNANAWDTSYAWQQSDPANTWDISVSNVDYRTASSISAEDSTPSGLFFKPDGKKMYVVGDSGDEVLEYDLSQAWEVGVQYKTYNQAFSVSSQDIYMSGLVFKPDGKRMYLSGRENDKVYEYSLTTPWDVSTASYLQSGSFDSLNVNPSGMFISDTGVHLYTVDSSDDEVFQYELTTPWDASSISYVRKFDIFSYESVSTGVFFKSDGTEMYIIGTQGDDVSWFSLTTAWDISTATYLQSYSVGGYDTTPADLYFKPDGSAFYVAGDTGNDIIMYTVGRAPLTILDSTNRSIAFNDDGTKMYTLGDQYADVYEYDLSTPWDIYTASYYQLFNGMLTTSSVYENTPTGMAFKPDGTKIYIVGQSTDRVHEYGLSTAWDITTMSWSAQFTILGYDSIVEDITFNDDGTKMYIIGRGSDEINEFHLGTAWDITSASYYQQFYVSSQTSTPVSLFFKSDGTKLFVLGGAALYIYDLSTPWDISTASHSYTKQLNQDANGTTTPYLQGIYFSPDGSKFFAVRANQAYQWVME